MNREDTIKDIAQYVCGACELDMTCKRDYGEFTYTCCDNALSPAVKIYEAGYRKTFTSDLANDTQVDKMKTKQEQIEEMAKERNEIKDIMKLLDKCVSLNPMCKSEVASVLYGNNYRKTEEVRKETAKEIFQKVVNICRKEEDFQDGTVNTQLEPLYFGIMNGCAFIIGEVKELAEQYGVEVEE